MDIPQFSWSLPQTGTWPPTVLQLHMKVVKLRWSCPSPCSTSLHPSSPSSVLDAWPLLWCHQLTRVWFLLPRSSPVTFTQTSWGQRWWRDNLEILPPNIISTLNSSSLLSSTGITKRDSVGNPYYCLGDGFGWYITNHWGKQHHLIHIHCCWSGLYCCFPSAGLCSLL